MDELGLFIGSLSHEIKNPINGIIGFQQLLFRTDLSFIQKQYVTSMNNCCLQLVQIINDILDFSKLSSGKMTVSPECFSLFNLKKDVDDILGQRLIEKKQLFTYRLEENIPEYIVVDKQKLLQVIINLISNAHKFTNVEGSIELYIENIQNKNLKFSVKDSGIGIKHEDISKLFNTFIQINQSTIKSGTGLGLTISKKIVELLGGSFLPVESIYGAGSTFSFIIPYKQVESYEKEIEKDIKKLKNKTVLVVDDNAENRILISELLFEWEMKPVVCSSPLEALRYVIGNRYNFSVGLIDICMPVMTGIELAKQIKEEKPLFPLIALSSLDSFVDTTHFEFKLDKPINKLQLFNCIFKIVNKKELECNYLSADSDSDSNSDLSSISSFDKDIKILVAEDFIYNQDVITAMLSNIGYKNVTIANDGKEAISCIETSFENNNLFDIIILDLKMPNIDGYGVLKYIKEKNYKDIKIIVITASIMEDDRKVCKKLGVKYFINKPIDFQQLKTVMVKSTEL